MNPRASILRADLLKDWRSAEAGGRQERHQMALKEDIGAKSCRRELASAEHHGARRWAESCTWVSLTGQRSRLCIPLQGTRCTGAVTSCSTASEQRNLHTPGPIRPQGPRAQHGRCLRLLPSYPLHVVSSVPGPRRESGQLFGYLACSGEGQARATALNFQVK